jgi:hypothetical protein
LKNRKSSPRGGVAGLAEWGKSSNFVLIKKTFDNRINHSMCFYLSFGSYKMELNRNLCAFSAGSKALRAGRYNGDAKAIVLCVAHNFFDALAQRRDCSRGATSVSEFTSIFTSSFTSESYINI